MLIPQISASERFRRDNNGRNCVHKPSDKSSFGRFNIQLMRFYYRACMQQSELFWGNVHFQCLSFHNLQSLRFDHSVEHLLMPGSEQFRSDLLSEQFCGFNSTCFTISANNVTLDCQGNEINYSKTSQGNGIILNGVNYTTIQNCTINSKSLAPQSNGITNTL